MGLTNEATWGWVVEHFGFPDTQEHLLSERESVLIPALLSGLVAALNLELPVDLVVESLIELIGPPDVPSS